MGEMCNRSTKMVFDHECLIPLSPAMQVSPLQVFELSQKQQAASAGISVWFRRTLALIRNSVDLRLIIFAVWLALILLYRVFYSVSYTVFQSDNPKCTDFSDCSDCLAPNFFLNETKCLWIETPDTKSCVPNIGIFENALSSPSQCSSLDCPLNGAALNGPFVCTASAQFTFLYVGHMLPRDGLFLLWLPLLILNSIQQCRFERLVSSRATARASSAQAAARLMLRQTSMRKPKETIPITCNRCGQHLPSDTFPRCTPCMYSQLLSGMWWLTLGFIPVIYFVWASWDPRVDTAFYYVLFLQVIPPAYLLFLLIVSFFGIRAAQRDEPTAAGEEAIPIEQAAAESSSSEAPGSNELTRLSDSSKAILQQVTASDFVEAILANIDYGLNAQELAARKAQQQQAQSSPQPEQAGAAGVIGGFFNKVVNAVQTAAATFQFSDQPKEVEQEEIVWATEFMGRKIDGGPWRKTFKIVWVETIVALLILWICVVLGSGSTSVLALSRGRLVSVLIGLVILTIWATFHALTRYCLVLTTKQVLFISRPVAVPFCMFQNPVLVARLPLSLVTQVKLRALVEGTWWAPFCIAGDGDGALSEGYCEFCVATQYRGDLESLEYLQFDLPDAASFKVALEQVGIGIDKMDPNADGVFGTSQRTRGLGHLVVLLIQIASVVLAAIIGLRIISDDMSLFNVAQALILFLFSIVFLTWSVLRRKIYISTTLLMSNPHAGRGN